MYSFLAKGLICISITYWRLVWLVLRPLNFKVILIFRDTSLGLSLSITTPLLIRMNFDKKWSAKVSFFLSQLGARMILSNVTLFPHQPSWPLSLTDLQPVYDNEPQKRGVYFRCKLMKQYPEIFFRFWIARYNLSTFLDRLKYMQNLHVGYHL